MTESERIALTLALDSGLPYVGLRGVSPDPSLLVYLPAALVRTAEIVPLRLQDNMLQVACASPDIDLEEIRSRFPRLALEVSLSGAQEIQNVRAAMGEAAT
jgi:type II secretion system (T2SS) protein E